MISRDIGKIKRVPLRELWKKEDKDFTEWLEKNIDYLNDILELDLSIIGRDAKVGPFRVDLFAEDSDGNKVIVENQLEKTDHDHLGKVLTYMINLDAHTAIWVSKEPRDEHIKVVEWLNETTPDDMAFYLIKLEAIRIENQPMAAPLFTILKGPSSESKELGAEKKEYAERHVLRKEFWTRLLDKAKTKTKLHSNVSPCIYSWIGTGAGKSGIGYNYAATYKYVGCEIYLDRGKDFVDPNINKIRFDELYRHKDRIESDFGGELNWERLDDRRASRISYRLKGIGLKDKDKWDELHNKLIDAMMRMDKAFKKYIRQLK